MGIGKSLGNIRKERGLSQAALSKAAGLSQQYISRIEQDKAVTLDTLIKYAKSLNYDVALYSEDDSTPECFRDRYINRKFSELEEQGVVIISHVAAAEALGLFSGFVMEYPVDYYAETDHSIDNTVWHKLFHNEFGVCSAGGINCTGVNQTINDLLGDRDRIDEGIILEALSTYYYRNNCSYDGLKIYSENQASFEELSNDAVLFRGKR